MALLDQKTILYYKKQRSKVFKSLDSRDRPFAFSYILAELPWAFYLTYLCFSFLFCKMGLIIVSTCYGLDDDLSSKVSHFETWSDWVVIGPPEIRMLALDYIVEVLTKNLIPSLCPRRGSFSVIISLG